MAFATPSTHTTMPNSQTKHLWPAAALLVLTACLFGRALSFPYTNWDDRQFIQHNAALQTSNPATLFSLKAIEGERLYIPLTYLSYWLERLAGGPTPATSHALNLLLHLLNILLVWALAVRLAPNPGPWTLMALAVFALHPLQVEAVCWAMGRKDLLSCSFALAATIAFLAAIDRNTTALAWIATTATALACLAKPSAIILPAIFVALLWLRQTSAKPYRLPLLASGLISIAIYLAAALLPNQGLLEPATLAIRLQALLVLAWHWTERLLLPVNLSPFYTISVPLTATILGALATAGFFLLLAKSPRTLRFPLLWLMLALAPAAAIVLKSRDFLTGDRYGYFALVGLTLLLLQTPQGLLRWLTSAWILLLTILAVPTVHTWRNSQALWTQALRYDQTNPIAWNNLGLAQVDIGQIKPAISTFQHGLALHPHDTSLRTNLGNAYLQTNQLDLALHQFGRVIQAYPWSFRALTGAGQAFEQKGQIPLAKASYQRALQGQPGYPPAITGLNRLQTTRQEQENGLQNPIPRLE